MNIVLFTSADNYFFSKNDERTKHIQKILHKNVGDTFEAGLENGQSGIATITSFEEGLSFDFTPTSDGKALLPIEMIVGFVRPIQLKRLFRDMASLGVQKIHLVATELGERSYMDSKIVERGTAHAALREGAIQAKSTHVPELVVHKSLKECLDMLDEKRNDALCVCLDNINPQEGLFDYIKKQQTEAKSNKKPIFAAIGSERGWSNNERLLFIERKYTLCSMGKRVLRTETAATVALSLLLESMGELQ